MKKLGIVVFIVFVGLIIIFNSSIYQKKHYPVKYYTKKVKELERDLIERDKSIQIYVKIFKSAEESAQKDYEEYLQLLYQTEPNESKDSLKTKAQKFISDHVLRFANLLQEAIDERNEINRKLNETKELFHQIEKRKDRSK